MSEMLEKLDKCQLCGSGHFLCLDKIIIPFDSRKESLKIPKEATDAMRMIPVSQKKNERWCITNILFGVKARGEEESPTLPCRIGKNGT